MQTKARIEAIVKTMPDLLRSDIVAADGLQTEAETLISEVADTDPDYAFLAGATLDEIWMSWLVTSVGTL